MFYKITKEDSEEDRDDNSWYKIIPDNRSFLKEGWDFLIEVVTSMSSKQTKNTEDTGKSDVVKSVKDVNKEIKTLIYTVSLWRMA